MLRKLRVLLLVPAALGFAFIILSAQAQSPAPSATPTVPACWSAEGWATCQYLARKHDAGIPLTPSEASEIRTCHPDVGCLAGLGECQRLIKEAEAGNLLTVDECEAVMGCPDYPKGLQVKCAPQSSPPSEPLPLPGEPQTLTPQDVASPAAPDPPVGPIGTPIPGSGGDACDGTPLDVAADAGAGEVVEFLNSDITVTNEKTGSQMLTATQSGPYNASSSPACDNTVECLWLGFQLNIPD